jgi:type II secretory pathway component PulM
MKKFWEKLGNREKIIILAGAGVAVLIALVQFAVLPFWDERERLARALEVQEKTLKEMNAQLAEHRVLKRDMDSIQRAMAARPPGFTLLSFAERKAREAGVRPNVKAINPSRGLNAGTYEEVLADVSLEKITLRQLVQFLYQADSPRDAVRVRKLTVRNSAESPEYLTATVQLATYQAAGAPRPNPAPVPPPGPARQGG